MQNVSISTLKVGDIVSKSGHYVSSVAQDRQGLWVVSIATRAGYTSGILSGDESTVITYHGHDASLEPAPQPSLEEQDQERVTFLRGLGLTDQEIEEVLEGRTSLI